MPSDDVTAPAVGVESGDEWMPPADPSKVAKLPQLTGAAPAAEKTWTVSDVKGALMSVTGMADVVAGDAVGAQLTMTSDEIDQLAPPLTNIINRSPRLRAMGSASDAVLVVLGMGRYGVRVGGEVIETRRQRIEAARNEAHEVDNFDPADGVLDGAF